MTVIDYVYLAKFNSLVSEMVGSVSVLVSLAVRVACEKGASN